MYSTLSSLEEGKHKIINRQTRSPQFLTPLKQKMEFSPEIMAQICVTIRDAQSILKQIYAMNS